MKKLLISTGIVLSSMSLAFAQGINVVVSTANNNVGGSLLSLLATAQTIVNRLVPFVIGLAVVAFFWYLLEFIWKGRDDEAAKKRSLSGMGYALLALFVMVSLWGIIGFFGSATGVGQGGSVPIPGIPSGPTNG